MHCLSAATPVWCVAISESEWWTVVVCLCDRNVSLLHRAACSTSRTRHSLNCSRILFRYTIHCMLRANYCLIMLLEQLVEFMTEFDNVYVHQLLHMLRIISLCQQSVSGRWGVNTCCPFAIWMLKNSFNLIQRISSPLTFSPAVPPPFRPSDPAVCGSHPLVTPH